MSPVNNIIARAILRRVEIKIDFDCMLRVHLVLVRFIQLSLDVYT